MVRMTMSAIYLTEADVERLVTMADAIAAVERAFSKLATGDAENVPRFRTHAPGIVLHSMSASAGYLRLVGWKNYTTTSAGAKFFVGLHPAETGELAALIEADRLGQLRTGAATAVGVTALADPLASELGLFGTGHQAETQLEAVAAVRPIKQVFVYGRDSERRIAFAERMSQRLNIEVRPVDRPQEAAEDLPIVVTATTSRVPVFDGRDLAEGTLVCAVGSNWLNRAEIDSDVIRLADNIVCDSIKACQNEAGDFVEAIEKGIFVWSKAVELGDVLTGKEIGRSNAASVVLFKSVGLAIEDLALGAVVLERAIKQAVGTPLPF
jgi:alanine dehydrogenase